MLTEQSGPFLSPWRINLGCFALAVSTSVKRNNHRFRMKNKQCNRFESYKKLLDFFRHKKTVPLGWCNFWMKTKGRVWEEKRADKKVISLLLGTRNPCFPSLVTTVSLHSCDPRGNHASAANLREKTIPLRKEREGLWWPGPKMTSLPTPPPA